jgi:hypothetical protein
MGAALALWGFSTGAPIAGLVLGGILEAARFAPSSAAVASRLPVAIRIVALAALAAFAYFAFTSPFPKALYAWLQWLPVVLLPLPLAQSLAGGSISGAALSKALRPGSPPDPADERVDATLAFLGVTLVGAAAGAAASAWFYAAAGAIVTWALIARVPRKARLAGLALALAGMAMGVAVHVGLSALQGNVEEWSTALLEEYFAAKPDVFKERTRIGDLGRVKLNDRILMRVVPVGARPPSLLYVLQKMGRRNKAAFAAVAVVTVALVSGFGVSTFLFVKEKHARERALVAEQTERKSREEAERECIDAILFALEGDPSEYDRDAVAVTLDISVAPAA